MITKFKKGQWYKYTGKKKLCSYNPTGKLNLVLCEIGDGTKAAFFTEDFKKGNTVQQLKSELKYFTKALTPVVMEVKFRPIPAADFYRDDMTLRSFVYQYKERVIHHSLDKKFVRVICKLPCVVGKDMIDNLKSSLKYPERVAIFKNPARGFYFAEFVITKR